jgi:glyoxylate carboligase
MMRTGGQWVVEQLLSEGVERVFCVPGESYLAVMDAMVDVRDRIDLVSCRHESGAAMMAVASGHLSGEPAVAFVTRGPGATNASIAVHIARQGSIPLVLGVGQVASRNLPETSAVITTITDKRLDLMPFSSCKIFPFFMIYQIVTLTFLIQCHRISSPIQGLLYRSVSG